MEDIILKADLDESTRLYVSPLDQQTYSEYVEGDILGGSDGYFVCRSNREGFPKLEVLAKASNMEAATQLFDMIVAAHRP